MSTPIKVPQYEAVYEVDDDDVTGSLLGFHFLGHDHHPDAIERFLNTEALDYLYEPDEDQPTAWTVVETWVRKVPIRATGGCRFVYSGPGRGAQAVTFVELPWRRELWCINHPDEPWYVGIPAGEVTDGEQIVEDRLAAMATEVDPRRNVSDDGRYIYLCSPCWRSFSERQREARIAAQRGVA